jgi:hypothetical protein
MWQKECRSNELQRVFAQLRTCMLFFLVTLLNLIGNQRDVCARGGHGNYGSHGRVHVQQHVRDGHMVRAHTRSPPGPGSHDSGVVYQFESVPDGLEVGPRRRAKNSTSIEDFRQASDAISRSAVDEDAAALKAASALTVAKKYLHQWGGKMSDGLRLSLLEIKHRYPNTPAAKEAEEIVLQVEKERKSERELTAIKAFIEIRMGVLSDNIKGQINDFIAKYPNTSVAEEAKSLLDKAELGRLTRIRFKTGESSPHKAIYRFDGYVDEIGTPSPKNDEIEIEVEANELLPPVQSNTKACWWQVIRMR